MSDSQITDIHGNPYNRSLLVLVLMVGSFCTILNSTLLATAFPAIMKSFDISTATVEWLTTGFMLVTGVMIPISAWMINKFNTRTMYIGAMLVFFIGTLLSFVAPNFSTLLAGRLIQGLGVGITMPLLQTIMLSIFPPEKRGAAMGTVGISFGAAPAVGPTLSGWIVDTFSWRDLFGMMLPIMLVVIILSFFLMKNVIPNRDQDIDVLSATTSIIGFGSMLYGFSKAGNDGWTNPMVVSFILIGIIFVILFGWRQLKMDVPFLDISVFKHSEFSLAAILTSISSLAMMGIEMTLPLYIQNIRGESAFHSGLIMLPGALLMAMMSPITGKLFDKYGAKYMALSGLITLTLGTIPFLFLTENTSILYITIFYAVRMFGIGTVIMTVITSGMNALPLRQMSDGTAVNNTLRQVISSIGTAILVSVLSTTTKHNMPSTSTLHATPLAYRDEAMNAVLSGYTAAFFVAIIFASIALFLALFLKKGNRAREAAALGGKK